MTEDYCKLVSGIILSTIWRQDDHTRILWITMLAVKDRHHRVMASVPGLAAVANLPVESVRASIEKLMAPDPDSRTKDHEGRRIAAIDGGWLVLNGEKYRNFLSKAERNEYQAKLMSERRAKQKSSNVSTMLAPVSKVSSELALLAHTEAEAVKTKSTNKFVPPSLDQVKLEAAKSGLPYSEAEKFFNYYGANGWKVGKNPMRSWRMALSGWKLRWQENKYGNNSISSGNPSRFVDRNQGTANAKTIGQYDGVGKIPRV